MNRFVRETLLIGLPPLAVLLVGMATVSGSNTTTDASGRSTTSSTGLADTPALGVYAAALAVLAIALLVRRRAWRDRGH